MPDRLTADDLDRIARLHAEHVAAGAGSRDYVWCDKSSKDIPRLLAEVAYWRRRFADVEAAEKALAEARTKEEMVCDDCGWPVLALLDAFEEFWDNESFDSCAEYGTPERAEYLRRVESIDAARIAAGRNKA